jgi:GNAT superfamily N-acetyltransferase
MPQKSMQTIAACSNITCTPHLRRWDPRNTRSWLIAALLLRGASPGGVLVAHDGSAARAPVLHALRVVLPELRRRGFGIVTLSELAAAAEEEAEEEAVEAATNTVARS